jgi:exopolysaccharide biosynthesis glucuronosyltransferase PssE
VIFVTVGTNEARFDRLLEAVPSIVADERVVVQCGSSRIRPDGADCLEFVSFEEMVELIREARVVVTHAGVGSILVSLMNDRRPIVVPRLKRFGEAVDDHQVPLAARLESVGLVTAVADPARDLVAAVAARTGAAPAHVAPTALVGDLREYLRSIV